MITDEQREKWQETAESTLALIDAYQAILVERDGLARRIEAVRALHTRVTADLNSGWIGTPFTECTACSRSWPCPTIRALDGEDGS